MHLKPSFFPMLLALLGAGDAIALGLGQISVQSRLGTRFQAEIELLGAPGDGRAMAECFRLTTPTDAEAGIPVLKQGRLTVARENGRTRLLISSEQFINDPVLQISVRAGCGAEVVRDYTLIIDPAETRATKPAPAAGRAPSAPTPPPATPQQPADDTYPAHWQTGDGESALSIARHLFPHQPTAQRRFLNALQAANSGIDLGSDGATPLPAGTPLAIPDTRRHPPGGAQAKAGRPASAQPAPVVPKKEKPTLPSVRTANGRMSDRLSISGNTFEAEANPDALPLRLATELSGNASANTTEGRRAIFRLEYKLLGAVHSQAGEQLDLAEKVRQLEASVAELQSATENSVRPAVPPAPREPPAPQPLPVVKDVGASQPVRRTVQEPSDGPGGWIALAAVLGGVVLLVWLLRRYSPKSASRAGHLAPDDSVPAEALPWAIQEGKPVQPDDYTEPPSHEIHILDDSTVIAENRPVVPPAQPSSAPEVARAATVVTEHYAFDPVMELADIMLSFGRVKGATDALLEYIEASPDEAIQPWLKLLDIYRQGGMREDYENLSRKLKFHFNVAPADWDTLDNLALQPVATGDEETAPFDVLLARLPNIQQIFHVRDEIRRTWGTAEGLAYLNRLLRDNRKGERTGFSLATVSELLFLLDVLERQLNSPPVGEKTPP